MIAKNRVLIAQLCLIVAFLMPGTLGEISIRIDINPTYSAGETVSFSYTISSDSDEQVVHIVSVDCPNEVQPLLALQPITLNANTPYTGTYQFGLITQDVEPQMCDAIVSIVDPVEITYKQPFEITTLEGFSFGVEFCKQKECTEKARVFEKGNPVYLNAISEIDNPAVTAIATAPSGKIKTLTLPDTLEAEELGTYELIATASKQGLKTMTHVYSFAVIEKAPEIAVEITCIVNNECTGDEDHQNCPQDCPSGMSDNYCDEAIDGRCDPDCDYQQDIDCQHTELDEPVAALDQKMTSVRPDQTQNTTDTATLDNNNDNDNSSRLISVWLGGAILIILIIGGSILRNKRKNT